MEFGLKPTYYFYEVNRLNVLQLFTFVPNSGKYFYDLDEDKIPLKHLSDRDMRMFCRVFVCCVNGH